MHDLIVIGAGPAGLAAACAAYDSGLRNILLVERDCELGGILNQCIHNGFGLHYFKEELTGPEYADRFIRMLKNTNVSVMLNTMALHITPQREVHTVGAANGYQVLRAKSIVLAMGCRERTRGNLCIPGTRPAGIFTAGTAQRFVNIEGYMVGKRVLILGSGDIGLIMARRMTLEGAKVLACVEAMSHPGGLNRNIVQCLQDYAIPLYLSHTVVDIQGRSRVEQVTVSKVDGKRNPIPGTEISFACDTLLLSVGLIPENELSSQAGILLDPRTNGAVVYENMETSVQGVFACGNVAHVHDLVDFVTTESQRAGKAAAESVLGKLVVGNELALQAGEEVSYTVPQRIRISNADQKTDVCFRVRRICSNSRIKVTSGGVELASYPRKHMAPGEMEWISLPYALLKQARDAIEISVEKE